MKLALVCLLGIGCATTAPSGFEVCNDYCDTAFRCGFSTEAERQNCRVMCQSRKAELDREDRDLDARCSNRADQYNAILTCHDRACDEVGGCLDAINTDCVPKN